MSEDLGVARIRAVHRDRAGANNQDRRDHRPRRGVEAVLRAGDRRRDLRRRRDQPARRRARSQDRAAGRGRPVAGPTSRRRWRASWSTQGAVFILSVSLSPATQQQQTVTMEAKTPQMTPMNSADYLTTQLDNPYFWQTGPLGSVQIATLLAHARTKNFKRVALITRQLGPRPGDRQGVQGDARKGRHPDRGGGGGARAARPPRCRRCRRCAPPTRKPCSSPACSRRRTC